MTLNNLPPFSMAFATLICLLLTFMVGRRINRYGRVKYKWRPSGLGAIETTSLGMFAFILGFIFAGVMTRHDDRRKIIVEEANNIGTAILRADLYDDSNRIAFRNDFQQYVEARIQYYKAGLDEQELTRTIEDANRISSRIWQRATSLSKDQKYYVASLQMIPALNTMIDIVTTRDAAMKARLSDLLIVILFIIIQFSAFLIGITSFKESLEFLSFMCYGIVATFAFMLILDLNRPETGLITLERSEQKMEALRAMFQ